MVFGGRAAYGGNIRHPPASRTTTYALEAIRYDWIHTSLDGANLSWPEECGLDFAAFIEESLESQNEPVILSVNS